MTKMIKKSTQYSDRAKKRAIVSLFKQIKTIYRKAIDYNARCEIWSFSFVLLLGTRQLCRFLCFDDYYTYKLFAAVTVV